MRAASSKRTIARTAAFSAACAAGLLSSGAYAQTYTSWGNLGKGGVSMSGTQPRQFAITVANGAVFGAYNSGDPAFKSDGVNNDDGAEIFKTNAPGQANIIHTFIVDPADNVGAGGGRYAGIDRIIYNPFDGQLYARSNAYLDWNVGFGAEGSVYPSPYNTVTPQAGVFKIDPTSITTTGGTATEKRIFNPSTDSTNAAYKNVTGLTLDTDTGAVLFSVNNGRAGSGNADRNIYFVKPGETSLHQILQGNSNRNIGQVSEGVVYAGKDANGKSRFIELDAGNATTNIQAFSLDIGAVPANTTAQVPVLATAGSYEVTVPTGASTGNTGGNGGVTAALFDRTNQTLHVMERQGSSLKVINTDFYPGTTLVDGTTPQTLLLQSGATAATSNAAIRNNNWHANIPGSTAAGNAGTAAAAVDVNGAVLTPDGNILMGFSGTSPYGVAGAESHLWLKQTVYNGTGTGRVAPGDNTTATWADLGVVDPGGGQIVSLTTGNIGSGSIGTGKNSYDVWTVTQDRTSGQLKLSSSATSFVRRLSFDRNGTTPGAGGTSPNGTWGTGNANFNDQLDGGPGVGLATANFTDTTTINDVVGFSAGNDATGSYDVNVVGAQVAKRIDFDLGSPTLKDGGGGSISAGEYASTPGSNPVISVPIAPSSGVLKTGIGQLTITNAQNYTGATTVSAGTLQFAQLQSLPGGTSNNFTVKGGAALGLNVGGPNEFSPTDVATLAATGTATTGFLSGSVLALDTTNATGGSFAVSGTIANPNGGLNVLGISKNGVGELVLSGSNTYGGGTIVNRGTVTATLGTSLGAGPLTVNSTNNDATVVNLSTTGATTIGSLAGTLTGSGTATINNGGQLLTVNQGTNGTYPGVINGAGGLTKAGGSTLTLSGTSGYTGATTISAGTIVAGTLADAGLTSSIGTGSASPSAADLVLNGGVLGYGGGTAASTNRQFTLTNAGGGFDVSGAGNLTLANTATVATTGSGARTLGLTGGGTGIGTLAAKISDGTGGATGVSKGGTGTWQLNNDTSDYTGPVNINGGVLAVTSLGTNSGTVPSALGRGTGAATDVTINGGTLQFNGAVAQNTSRQFTVPGGANGTIDASGTTATATVSLSGALNQTGSGSHTITLTGTNAGDGVLTGTNAAINANKNTFSGNIGNIVADPTNVLTGQDTSLVKSGTGTWVVSGDNSFLGGTTVNAGTLILAGISGHAIGNPADIGRGSGAGPHTSNNDLTINGTSKVLLNDSAATFIEKMAVASGSSLVLRGQRLNMMTGASTNNGASAAGVISGTGGLWVGPLRDGDGITGNLYPFYAGGGFPSVLNKTFAISGSNTYTGGTHIQGGNLDVTTLTGLGDPSNTLELSNLRNLTGIAGGVVTLNMSGLANGLLTTTDLTGTILPPDPAKGGINSMTVNMGTGGGRVLDVKQLGDSVYRGGLSGQNANAGGGEFRLDAGSTGTLTFIGATISQTNNATAAAATIAAGGMANGGVVRVNGGTLLLKTPGALSRSNLPLASDPFGGALTREVLFNGATASTGGAGVVVGAGGTLAVNVGGPALVYGDANNPLGLNQPGTPTVGAEWTAADVDRLKNVGTFSAGSMLGFDTTNAPGGTFAYNTALGGLNGNQPAGNAQGATPQADNTGMGVAKLGTGTLTLGGASTMTGPTSVRKGTLVAANSTALPTGAVTIARAAGDTTSTPKLQLQAGLPNAVAVASVTTAGPGLLDLTNNSMVIRSSSLAAVQASITSGFANGAWTGVGIDSSTAAADATHRTAIGYASNSVLNKTSFKNVSGLTGSDILVKYTYYGDADLNGVVTLDDFTQFLSGYQGNGNTWLVGDFDYNGKVTLDDFTLFLDAYQNQGAPLAALDEAVASASISSSDRAFMLAAIQAVPEPTSLALLGVAGAGLLARRRRRSN